MQKNATFLKKLLVIIKRPLISLTKAQNINKKIWYEKTVLWTIKSFKCVFCCRVSKTWKTTNCWQISSKYCFFINSSLKMFCENLEKFIFYFSKKNLKILSTFFSHNLIRNLVLTVWNSHVVCHEILKNAKVIHFHRLFNFSSLL